MYDSSLSFFRTLSYVVLLAHTVTYNGKAPFGFDMRQIQDLGFMFDRLSCGFRIYSHTLA